jgi:hypothetical protein
MWEHRLHGSVIPNDTDVITALVVPDPEVVAYELI